MIAATAESLRGEELTTRGATIGVVLAGQGKIAAQMVRTNVGQEGIDGGMTVKRARVSVIGILEDTGTETTRTIIALGEGEIGQGSAQGRAVAHQGMNDSSTVIVVTEEKETGTRTVQFPVLARAHAPRGLRNVENTGTRTMMTATVLANVTELRHARHRRATDLESLEMIPRDMRRVRLVQLLKKNISREMTQIHWRISLDHSLPQQTAKMPPQSAPEDAEPTRLKQATLTRTSPPVMTLPSTSTQMTTTIRPPVQNPPVVPSPVS